MKRNSIYVLALAACLCGASATAEQQPQVSALEAGFQHPPHQARLRCYWWWLNGHTDNATITRDLEEMQRKGYGGAILVDANGASQGGNDPVPPGPEFGSAAWTKLYVHALHEAQRLGLEITLNLTSGWNLGGPWVKAEDASKLMTWSRKTISAADAKEIKLDPPQAKNGFYRQIAVLAYPLHRGEALPGTKDSHREALHNLQFKSAAAEMGLSMNDTSELLTDEFAGHKDEDVELHEVIDISKSVAIDGTVHWRPPSGIADVWEILCIGYTDSDARVSTASGNWQGLAIDYLNPKSLDLYWNTNILPLLEAAKPYAGKSLKYVATDSWELGGTNWTDGFRDEFRKRRGYDPVPYLPIVSGRIIGSRELSTKFLADLRRTVADLVTSHYDHMAQLAGKWGLGVQAESGGPHTAPLDALETFRHSAIPQTEYWAMSQQHRTKDTDRFFVKEASSASHIYGRPLAAAEGPTSIGNQWDESIGMNLRPTIDQAFTEGMNRIVWHAFTSSPASLGLPGQEYFAGTHLNPNTTWWHVAESFFSYLNRVQFLLQQGRPVSDVLYMYGDSAPNFVRLKRDDPAGILPGYDYDVVNTDALLRRMKIVGGEIRTPEGIFYKALVLPKSRILPLSVLQFAKQYVQSGGTLIGLRPLRSQGIVPSTDAERFTKLVEEMWSDCEKTPEQSRSIGKGNLFCTESGRGALRAIGILPDFEVSSENTGNFDFVHRRTAAADIYFVRNTTSKPLQAAVTFRIAGRLPEFFHADTGRIEDTLIFSSTSDGRTQLPLSLDPYGSVFVVFRHLDQRKNIVEINYQGKSLYSRDSPGDERLPDGLKIGHDKQRVILSTPIAGTYEVTAKSGRRMSFKTDDATVIPVTGQWSLSFPPNWGAPGAVQLEQLKSWSLFSDEGIRYFSGSAIYRAQIQIAKEQLGKGHTYYLDLGEVHEIAAVRINGHAAGIVWKKPYRLDLEGLLKPGTNAIQVEVTNLWPNRLIGDAQSSAEKRYTWTNIRAYTRDSPLLPSGLIGPVALVPLYRMPIEH